MLTMREEDMNMVAGGDLVETCADNYSLYKAGCMRENLSIIDFVLDWADSSKKVEDAWGAVGVNSETHLFDGNKYRNRDQEITRDEALKHLWS